MEPVHLTFLLNAKRFLFKNKWIYKSFFFIAGYGIWVIFARLLALTFITYLTVSPSSHFQDISEAFSSNEVSVMGYSALLFLIFLYGLTPLSPSATKEFISSSKIEKDFLPGFIRGTIAASSLVLTFLLLGFYRNLGYLIQFHEAPLELLNIFLRIGALISLAYCEEYFFRHRLVQDFSGRLSSWGSAVLITIFYCGIKLLQFDLGWMQLITLSLVSLSLSHRALRGKTFSSGAGLWTGILTTFHPLLSLPVFGNDFSGILLVKSQIVSHENFEPIRRLVTGGAGGPLASLVFQALLVIDISRSVLNPKKIS